MTLGALSLIILLILELLVLSLPSVVTLSVYLLISEAINLSVATLSVIPLLLIFYVRA